MADDAFLAGRRGGYRPHRPSASPLKPWLPLLTDAKETGFCGALSKGRKNLWILLRTRISYTIISPWLVFKPHIKTDTFECLWQRRQRRGRRLAKADIGWASVPIYFARCSRETHMEGPACITVTVQAENSLVYVFALLKYCFHRKRGCKGDLKRWTLQKTQSDLWAMRMSTTWRGRAARALL